MNLTPETVRVGSRANIPDTSFVAPVDIEIKLVYRADLCPIAVSYTLRIIKYWNDQDMTPYAMRYQGQQIAARALHGLRFISAWNTAALKAEMKGVHIKVVAEDKYRGVEVVMLDYQGDSNYELPEEIVIVNV